MFPFARLIVEAVEIFICIIRKDKVVIEKSAEKERAGLEAERNRTHIGSVNTDVAITQMIHIHRIALARSTKGTPFD